MLWNNPFDFPILSWIVFLPAVGALLRDGIWTKAAEEELLRPAR